MVNSNPSRGRAALTIALLAAALAAIGAWAYLRRGAAPDARDPSVQVPADFGGAVRSSALARVAAAATGEALNSMSLALDLGGTVSPPRFAIGDRMRINARAGEPARCAVFHRNAEGTFRLFHPEQGESAVLSPGQRWDSGELRVTEPAGSESFLLLCRSEGAPSFELRAVLERPRDEWRAAFSAVRADFEVTR